MWRSLVARLLWEQDVAGSNPVVPTICGCGSMVELKPSKLMTRVRFPSPAPDLLRPRILFLVVFLYGERACLLFIEHAPWSSAPRSLRKYRIHSVDGKNGVNLLFLVSLILFRDMHEEIDSRIFDPPPSFLRQEK